MLAGAAEFTILRSVKTTPSHGGGTIKSLRFGTEPCSCIYVAWELSSDLTLGGWLSTWRANGTMLCYSRAFLSRLNHSSSLNPLILWVLHSELPWAGRRWQVSCSLTRWKELKLQYLLNPDMLKLIISKACCLPCNSSERWMVSDLREFNATFINDFPFAHPLIFCVVWSEVMTSM